MQLSKQGFLDKIFNKTIRPKGFSLIEILVGIAILGVLLTAIYSLFMSANKSQISQDLEVEMQQNARSAVEFVSRELRNIGTETQNCPANTPTINCMENTTSPCGTSGDKVIFFSMTDCNDARIFSWSSNDNILRFSKAPVGSEDRQLLADHITAFTMTPFGEDNNPTNALGNVRRIDITVTSRTSKKDPTIKDYRTLSSSTTVKLRN